MTNANNSQLSPTPFIQLSPTPFIDPFYLSNHAGSIMRLNLDGSVPDDNPYKKNKKFLPEVWSYGHRNPQGLTYDSESKRLWSIEHGPRGGDEINLIQSGANYGWPKISYGK